MVVPVELHLAGGIIRVHHDGPCPWMHRYDAFMESVAYSSFEIDLFIESGDPQAISSTEVFVYERMDLSFAMNAPRTQARGTSNGSESAFLALLELTLQGALSPLGGILVHAAGCVIDGQAWLIPGPSGTGKSTAAREAGFSSVLSDERVAVVRGQDGWQVWGTPFWSEGQTLPMNPGFVPLAGLIKLVKDQAFSTQPLDTGSALVHLMESITLYESCPMARTRAFETAHEIVTNHRGLQITTPRRLAWATPSSWAA